MKIPITKPLFGEEERRAMLQPLDTGWVVQGPAVAEFERKFGAYVGATHALATTSCTTALHLGVCAFGLRPGDEVIVPAFTWIATANVVEYMGATPVFCDIDLATFNIDVAQLDALITPRTVGIIPVHLFGLCADMDAVMAIARRRGLWVLEDAACGFGATIRGTHAGVFGDAGAFSFHPRKAITTGEGGMLTTQRSEIAADATARRDHGASRSDLARHSSTGGFLLPNYDVLGFNYRMTDFQGALGSVQMDRADFILSERRRVAASYDARLRELAWLQLPITPDGYGHGYQSYVTLFAPEEPLVQHVERLHEWRNRVMAKLETEGIATRQGTHAPVLLGYYAKKYELTAERFPESYLADRLSLSLPVYAGMTEDEIGHVCDRLASALNG
jgi:dTDP-4-amino-4,6-dideoxygalactose transaminase